MTKTVAFYFDFMSPYGYFASRTIEALAERCDAVVEWRAFVVGAAFKLTGAKNAFQRAPIQMQYGMQDLFASAAFWGVPFKMPQVFGVTALPPSRAFYWVADQAPDRLAAFTHAVYRRVWVEDVDMREVAPVAALLDDMGLDGAAAMAWATSDAGKARLKAETDAAVGRGAFGSPFFFVDEKSFWGADRLPMLEWWLKSGGDRPAALTVD